MTFIKLIHNTKKGRLLDLPFLYYEHVTYNF